VLYGLTCLWTIIAFSHREEFSLIKHGIVPAVGLLANVVMLVAIVYLYIIGNANAQSEAYICFAISGGWALVSAVYVVVTSHRKGRRLLHAPRTASGTV
jgi:hypothetical protein